MRKALGATREDECRLGVHKIANVSFFSQIKPPKVSRRIIRVLNANFLVIVFLMYMYSY